MPTSSFSFRKIFRNFFSLNLVLLSNFIFPLVTLPYVVRIIGVENFGLINFVQATIMYVVLVSDYSFNLSGTREISFYRDDKNKISEIFSSILILKILIGLSCCIFFIILVLSIKIFAANWLLYFISTGILIGSILFPLWFFQGIEKMESIPAINIPIRTLQLIFIFLLVREQSDYVLYMIIISITQIAIGITGLIVSVYIFKVKVYLPSLNTLVGHLKRGFNLFSASIGINLFHNSNVLILGILIDNYAVGIFSAADKIRSTVQSVVISFIMAVYPNAVRLAKERMLSFYDLIRKTFKISVSIGLICSLLLLVFSQIFINILFGNEFKESIILLRFLSITPLIVSIGLVFNILIIVLSGNDLIFSKIILFSTLIHIIILVIYVLIFHILGTVYSIVTTESLITLFSIYVVYRKKLFRLKSVNF